MLHGPEYRAGPDPDVADYRARRRHGRHRGDQAVKMPRKGGLSTLIFMALLAVAFMVWTHNQTLMDVIEGGKHLLLGSVAHDMGRPCGGDTNDWADGTYRETGGCEHAIG